MSKASTVLRYVVRCTVLRYVVRFFTGGALEILPNVQAHSTVHMVRDKSNQLAKPFMVNVRFKLACLEMYNLIWECEVLYNVPIPYCLIVFFSSHFITLNCSFNFSYTNSP